MAYGIAKILAHAKPTPIMEKIKNSLLGAKYIEIKPNPPQTSENACVFLRPKRAAMDGNKSAYKAESRL